jgi:peptidoglycan hydrolase CwlO-like protein
MLWSEILTRLSRRSTLLGEHEEESSQKITELEALCRRLREDAQKLKKQKTTLEGMIQSHDELIIEMAEEYGLNRMGENDDDDDEGSAIAPPAPAPAAVPEEIIEEEASVENGPHELDDDPNEGCSDMDEWFPQDGSNDRD